MLTESWESMTEDNFKINGINSGQQKKPKGVGLKSSRVMNLQTCFSQSQDLKTVMKKMLMSGCKVMLIQVFKV